MLEKSSAQLTLIKNGVLTNGTLDEASTFILNNGWAPSTTRQYAAAVNKFLTFLKNRGDLEVALPSSSQKIYAFILWCSTSDNKTVLSKTTTRYLTGLRMWHALHDQPFPAVNLHRVRLLLKGCSKLEIRPVKKVRAGLKLSDVLALTDILTNDNLVDLVTKAVLLTGFWGMARLGELTFHRDHPDIFVRRKDVTFSNGGKSAAIKVRLAKTAKHGEIQTIHLRAQPNRLDPINALFEVLNRVPGTPNSPLFPRKGWKTPLSRSHVTNFLKANGPAEDVFWSGHSLRIGGASFQSNMGRGVKSLKALGCWKSSAYELYIRKYSHRELTDTKLLARHLHF